MRNRKLSSLGLLAVVALVPEVANAQSAGTLTAVDQGKVRFRYTRGKLSLDLEDRDSKWTEEEADKVRRACDKMPDVILRKAWKSVKRVYRDKHPRTGGGVKPANVLATTVARDGYITVSDGLMNGKKLEVYQTFIHEFGHAVHYGIAGNQLVYETYTKGWTGISWTNALTDGLKSWNGFVSDYARTNDHEDFAESVEFYWLAPDELRKANRAKYDYMRDVVFEGLVSPESSRDPKHTIIDKVVPTITSLGDRSDTNGSIVSVRGNYFMGPLDGGFNTVRYRGTKALHLPISRTRITSWVPLGLSSGSAPITVTTQDGKSAGAEFTVKKPWWKFW